jgi:hypothetical protein
MVLSQILDLVNSTNQSNQRGAALVPGASPALGWAGQLYKFLRELDVFRVVHRAVDDHHRVVGR